MVGGQSIDLESENKKIDMATLKKMHLGKTGALFKAAIRSGRKFSTTRRTDNLRRKIRAGFSNYR